jgi:hypothetical protein
VITVQLRMRNVDVLTAQEDGGQENYLTRNCRIALLSWDA